MNADAHLPESFCRSGELFILLSDLCNFKCGHCINSSGPKGNRWRISKSEIALVADFINSSLEVESVHFSGGEPTLHLDWIADIQSRVSRNVSYSLTTNGWYGARAENVLERVRLNRIIVSYDRYHAPFITLNDLVAFINICRQAQVEVQVNLVIEEGVTQVAEALPLKEAGAEIVLSRLIQGGRSQSEGALENRPHDTSASARTCPSLGEAKTRSQEKLNFIPGLGLTPCCGPLVFDELGERAFVSSTLSVQKYANNSLRSQLRKGSFAKQADELGIDLSHGRFESSCAACTFLYGKNPESGLPSLHVLAEQKSSIEFYPTKAHLPPDKSKALFGLFEEKYAYLASSEVVSQWADRPGSKPDSLRVRDVSRADAERCVSFVMKSFYEYHEGYYTKAEVAEAARLGHQYFSEFSVKGRLYLKDEDVVGIVFGHDYQPHRAFKENTFHIGYWGLSKDKLSRDESRWIKSDWFGSLKEWAGGVSVDGGVNYFNEPARRFIQANGFALKFLRLDRKKT